MAEINGLLHLPHQQNQALNSLFTALDPKSLILSQFPNSDQPPRTLELITDSFFFERGPRYEEYADLRESRLRAKTLQIPSSLLEENVLQESSILIPKKQVKFQSKNFTTPPRKQRGSSILAQSVPDFSSALRKENRKPSSPLLPPVMEKSATPPAGMKTGRSYGVLGKVGGSKSANSGGEKRGCGGGGGSMMVRKSYANIEELKSLASAARNAINGDNKNGGGRITRGAGKTILGYRQF